MKTELTATAHALAAQKINAAFSINEHVEIENYTNEYVSFVMGQLAMMSNFCVNPAVFIGQEIDCSKYVQGQSIYCDCILIADGVMQLIFLDLNTRKDPFIPIDSNANLKLCTRAALDIFDGDYDIGIVTISVCQPQHDRTASHTTFKESIYQWADDALSPSVQEKDNKVIHAQPQPEQRDILTEEIFLAKLQPIAALLARKNRDYGNSYALLRGEYGSVAFHLRLADKLNRLKQVDGSGALVSDESAIDTIRDIIGYCALELVYRDTANNMPNSG